MDKTLDAVFKIAAVLGLGASAVTFVSGKTDSSITPLSSKVDSLQSNIVEQGKIVTSIVTNDKNQDIIIGKMQDNVEYIRRVTEEMARRQGINVKQ